MQELLAPHFRLICGVDPSRKMLKSPGGSRSPRVQFDGLHLPFRSEVFDFCYAVCVFHHIPAASRGAVMEEILRVLKPSDRFILIEHNPANPLVRHMLQKCAMDEDADFLDPAEATGLWRKSFWRVPGLPHRKRRTIKSELISEFYAKVASEFGRQEEQTRQSG